MTKFALAAWLIVGCVTLGGDALGQGSPFGGPPIVPQAPASTPPPGARLVAVVNQRAANLVGLVAVPAGARGLGLDLLSGRQIISGGNATLPGPSGDGTCLFDVTAAFADGHRETRNRVDLCEPVQFVFGR
jgi:hypothetical protein